MLQWIDLNTTCTKGSTLARHSRITQGHQYMDYSPITRSYETPQNSVPKTSGTTQKNIKSFRLWSVKKIWLGEGISQ